MSFKLTREEFIAATKRQIPDYTDEKYPGIAQKFDAFKSYVNILQRVIPKLDVSIVDEICITMVHNMQAFSDTTAVKETIAKNIEMGLAVSSAFKYCLDAFVDLMKETFEVSSDRAHAEINKDKLQTVEVGTDEEEREALAFAKKHNLKIRIVRTDYGLKEPTKLTVPPTQPMSKLSIDDLMKETGNMVVESEGTIITANSSAGRMLVQACNFLPQNLTREQFAAQLEMFTIAVEKGATKDTGILEMLRAHGLVTLRPAKYMDRANTFIMHLTPEGVQWCLENYYDLKIG